MVGTGCSRVEAVALRCTFVGELELEPVRDDMVNVCVEVSGWAKSMHDARAQKRSLASHTCDAWLDWLEGLSATGSTALSGSELLARRRYARRACQLGPALR